MELRHLKCLGQSVPLSLQGRYILSCSVQAAFSTKQLDDKRVALAALLNVVSATLALQVCRHQAQVL